MAGNKGKSSDSTTSEQKTDGSTKPTTSKTSTTQEPVSIAVIEPGQKK